MGFFNDLPRGKLDETMCSPLPVSVQVRDLEYHFWRIFRNDSWYSRFYITCVVPEALEFALQLSLQPLDQIQPSYFLFLSGPWVQDGF